MTQAYRRERAQRPVDSSTVTIHPTGANRRRGPFRAGERVQLTDVKGRKYTTMLTVDGYFQSTRGRIRHSEIIGKPEGSVLDTHDGYRLLALRPLIGDYVLSMPRGATPIYPKDAAQIVSIADIFPGARVIEAGVGSGALSLSLLAAIGPEGYLHSVERREDFAEIAVANVESWYGDTELPWKVEIGDLAEVMDGLEADSVDHVLLDMLAPWENLDGAMRILRPGGVILAYVATTTQLSRFVEEVRQTFSFTEVEATETLVRTWHLEGLAVRPDHRMVAHTGFLVVARRLAPDTEPLLEKRRPAKLAYSDTMPWEDPTLAPIVEHEMAPKKLRRVLRDVRHRALVEKTGSSHGIAPTDPGGGVPDVEETPEGQSREDKRSEDEKSQDEQNEN
ncbi:tRNA (adenine-N1)-methyltransferase [Flaviflexus ciconiae]|uniref:tRNA (Adenine-N1)-methyltransferase n=1 Tax=Flaviflexus ciconiae TaxID=2496867 RepID=A0A3S9PVM6_9ACTO|nr:tRNA (adenine-N1)-methyltransferase [Flaviflexus ciconiae]